MQISIFKLFNSKLESIWLELESRTNPYIFQRFHWLEHWQDTIGRSEFFSEPCIVVIADEKGSQALLPFCIYKKMWFNVLSFIGGDQADYNSFISTKRGQALLKRTDIWLEIEKLLPNYDLLQIDRIPENVPYEVFNLNNNMSFLGEKEAYAAELPANWEEYQKRLTSKIKSDSRRQQKRLAELGKLRFEILNINSEEAKPLIKLFFAQKQDRYHSMGAKDIFSAETTKAFYSAMPKNLGKKAKIHFSVLWLDDRVLSTHWGAYDNERFYFLMPTFSHYWRRFSPGRLLMEHLLRWSIEKKLKCFDFTVGGEEYKKEWCNKRTNLYEIVQPRNKKGLFFVWLLLTKRLIIKSQVFRSNIKWIRKLRNKSNSVLHN